MNTRIKSDQFFGNLKRIGFDSFLVSEEFKIYLLENRLEVLWNSFENDYDKNFPFIDGTIMNSSTYKEDVLKEFLRLNVLSKNQIFNFLEELIRYKKEPNDLTRLFNTLHQMFLGQNISSDIDRLNKLNVPYAFATLLKPFKKNDNAIDGNKIEGYVDDKRLSEIKAINNESFDFTKLIEFLEELNLAKKNEMLLVIPLIIRGIIDHVPPIFKKANFQDMCNSYGTKSFRESITNLNKSSRKIADSILHTSIRRQESLPNKTQVDYKNDLDVLLQEIVRICK